MEKVELKRKVTLRRKGGDSTAKSKWWLWLCLLLALIAIAVVVFLVKHGQSDSINQPVSEKIEQATVKVDEVVEVAQTPETEEPAMPPSEEVVTPVTSEQSATAKPAASTSTTTLSQGTLEEKAWQVIRGDYGNGEERKRALGSEYNAIQSTVNDIYLNGQIY